MILKGNAYSYVRFSSERQHQGDSLRRQLKRAEDFAKKHDLTLDSHSYSDLGVSAFKGKNAIEGKLGTFLKAVDDGIIKSGSILLVESLDRISRAQVDEALELFLSIIRRGVTIVTLMDEQVYSRERIKHDKGMSLIISLTYMMRAHEESATKSTRIKAAWENKRTSWTPGTLIGCRSPSWVKPNKERSGWEIVPDKAATVQRIYKMAAEGFGQIKITNTLNEEGVPTMETAKYWTQGVVGALLRNPSVMGALVQKIGGNHIIEDYYPAVVPKETWLFVQDAIKNRRTTGGTKSSKTSNLFRGLSYCLYCGGRTRFVSTFKGTPYIHCISAYSNAGCGARPFPYAAAETAILDRLMNSQLRRLDNKFESEEVDKRIIINAEIDQLKDRQSKAISMMLSLPDVTPLQAELKRIQERIDALDVELRAIDLVPITSDDVDDAAKLFIKHRDMDKDSPELEDLRRSMHSAILRLLRKVEWGSNFLESDLYAKEGAQFFDGKTPTFKMEGEPNFILQLTFASGKVRIVDATKWVKARNTRKKAA